jgi:hypothetical protein
MKPTGTNVYSPKKRKAPAPPPTEEPAEQVQPAQVPQTYIVAAERSAGQTCDGATASYAQLPSLPDRAIQRAAGHDRPGWAAAEILLGLKNNPAVGLTPADTPAVPQGRLTQAAAQGSAAHAATSRRTQILAERPAYRAYCRMVQNERNQLEQELAQSTAIIQMLRQRFERTGSDMRQAYHIQQPLPGFPFQPVIKTLTNALEFLDQQRAISNQSSASVQDISSARHYCHLCTLAGTNLNSTLRRGRTKELELEFSSLDDESLLDSVAQVVLNATHRPLSGGDLPTQIYNLWHCCPVK